MFIFLQFVNFIEKLIHQPVLRHPFDHFPFFGDQTELFAADNGQVGFPRLPRSVYHSAHNRYMEILIHVNQAVLHLLQ